MHKLVLIYKETYFVFTKIKLTPISAIKSFLENVRDVWEKDRGQIDLQEQLLLDILKTRKLKVHSIEKGKTMIKRKDFAAKGHSVFLMM